jgi:hypothetical protein
MRGENKERRITKKKEIRNTNLCTKKNKLKESTKNFNAIVNSKNTT